MFDKTLTCKGGVGYAYGVFPLKSPVRCISVLATSDHHTHMLLKEGAPDAREYACYQCKTNSGGTGIIPLGKRFHETPTGPFKGLFYCNDCTTAGVSYIEANLFAEHFRDPPHPPASDMLIRCVKEYVTDTGGGFYGGGRKDAESAALAVKSLFELSYDTHGGDKSGAASNEHVMKVS